MKKLINIIQEKLIINKNSKIKSNNVDDIDELMFYDELYQLLDEIYNDKIRWNGTSRKWEDERDDYFTDLVYGDHKTLLNELLDELVSRKRISQKDADKYSNNKITIEFCKDISRKLMNNKHIDVDKIYKELAF